MRAITFGIDNNTGVAGFVNPDSHVDIMSIVGGWCRVQKAQPILSDVEAIAVGQSFTKAPGGAATPASSVTVALTPEDSQKLIKAISSR